ncbi:metal dependent phosphohydrolase [Solidesulfovibrio fructosivorans JJ]]|uniref:Metal dependent phosphohydrolase n=1 Tax=Solidesulfovibrio fructosivorans JJ] TaxID=596151 RepID=E1K2I2_SOLFR|nr:HDIG domain-containing metalloprotein [Solidesulfovibrio fructosivorans]EFL49183.1 metal dependent phosphohydrolase [Solidesulfovibrio fructosivorans JJ]]
MSEYIHDPGRPKPESPPGGQPFPPDPPRVSFVPTDAQCRELWDAYGMLPNIREHSALVACMATALAEAAVRAGLDVDVATVRAAGLLHDLAKTYTIRHGGNHCQLGGAWVQELTGNPTLAQGVACHVTWNLPIDLRAHFLPLTIIYSDKRVKHNQIVTLEARFDDLLTRYGKTDYIRERIRESFQQASAIETALAQTLDLDLHESTFGCGRLVK